MLMNMLYICIIVNTNKNIFHKACKAWKKGNNNNNLIDICGYCQLSIYKALSIYIIYFDYCVLFMKWVLLILF